MCTRPCHPRVSPNEHATAPATGSGVENQRPIFEIDFRKRDTSVFMQGVREAKKRLCMHASGHVKPLSADTAKHTRRLAIARPTKATYTDRAFAGRRCRWRFSVGCPLSYSIETLSLTENNVIGKRNRQRRCRRKLVFCMFMMLRYLYAKQRKTRCKIQ